MVQEFHRTSTEGRALAAGCSPRSGVSAATGGFPARMAADPTRVESCRKDLGLPLTVVVTEPHHLCTTLTERGVPLPEFHCLGPARPVGCAWLNVPLSRIAIFRRRRCVFEPARQSAAMVHRENKAACDTVHEAESIKATPRTSKRVQVELQCRSRAKHYTGQGRNRPGFRP